MNFFIKYELKRDSIILLDEEFKIDLQSSCIIDAINKESIGFPVNETIADISIIWNKKIVPNALIISKKDLPNHWRNTWSVFKKKTGSDFFIIFRPIFNLNNDLVFIYSAYYCGDRCGNESLKLFKRRDSSWVLIKIYCEKES